jgi:hypothetical protein
MGDTLMLEVRVNEPSGIKCGQHNCPCHRYRPCPFLRFSGNHAGIRWAFEKKRGLGSSYDVADYLNHPPTTRKRRILDHPVKINENWGP